MTKLIPAFLLAFLSISTFAQNNKQVLLTIDDKPVYANEFKRVFKKNLNLVQDNSQKSVDGYMELFIEYKLKVTEAYAQGIDKNSEYQKEFAKYEDQLSRNYIYEDKITTDLAKEGYDRGLEEIETSHILIKSSFNDTPADTLKAYNAIKIIRDKALTNTDFGILAAEFSEEPKASERKGYLGYFSAFDMVYPFESMAYNTDVGAVSEIVRTSFGYHIINVTDRRVKAPKIVVSHIMIANKKDDPTFNAETRINELSQLINQGESFEELAMQYSDDKNSGKNGGKLSPFGKGQLRAAKFEEEAYKLKTPGEISKPIKSNFGWHIIRFEEQVPVKPFEDSKVEIEKKVMTGNRGKVVVAALNDLIKKKFGFSKKEDFLPYFTNYVSDSILKRKWEITRIPTQEDKAIFSIGTKDVTFTDFASFVVNNQRNAKFTSTKTQMLNELYNDFEAKELKSYFRKVLENENPEYAGVINEYREGLLIFDVMKKNIWDKAKNDSLGVQKYFEGIKHNYTWKQRVEIVLVSSSSLEAIQQAQKMLQEGIETTKIKQQLNKDKVSILITSGVFEIDDDKLPKQYEIKAGVSNVFSNNNTHKVVQTLKIIPEGNKNYEDVKGLVLNQYQQHIEKEWLRSLKEKYKVVLNKKTLKKIKKELDQ